MSHDRNGSTKDLENTLRALQVLMVAVGVRVAILSDDAGTAPGEISVPGLRPTEIEALEALAVSADTVAAEIGEDGDSIESLRKIESTLYERGGFEGDGLQRLEVGRLKSVWFWLTR